jgi:hypothetical protein
MNPRVKAVRPNPDHTVTLLFTNGDIRRFDVKPYLDKGVFRDLVALDAFYAVRPFLGSIQWRGGQDFCPDTLFMDSLPVDDDSDGQWQRWREREERDGPVDAACADHRPEVADVPDPEQRSVR